MLCSSCRPSRPSVAHWGRPGRYITTFAPTTSPCHESRRLLADRHNERAVRQSTQSSRSVTWYVQMPFSSPLWSRNPNEGYKTPFTWIRSYRSCRFYSASSDTTPTTQATPSPTEPSNLEKPDYLNDAESTIWDTLVAEFAPTELMVQDISGGCGSMYGIEITSEKFRGKSLLAQHQMVNGLLRKEMENWHGLQLRTKVP
ncbi:bola-like protein [Hypoxylon sp. NC1633]|nr:bola-like protein [Hypoxylon sp. NC1633]